VLVIRAAGQFLMTLDTSVMNVSIRSVANDLGTTVTGIQTAITLYTLVMAAFMITGGKIGALIGRRRSSAYGLIAAAGAIAVAAGPLVGGAVTTFASWRWVFAGEVVIVLTILLSDGGSRTPPSEASPSFDTLGALLLWEAHLEEAGRSPMVRLSMFKSMQMTGGLVTFFFQFLIQSGIFFTIPLFLSVMLELSALQTGLRLLPLSLTLLLAALAVPKLAPRASPRLVVRLGMLAMLAGTLVLVGGLDPGANAGIVLIPMALVGLGIGALGHSSGR
jgi:MFS family permease